MKEKLTVTLANSMEMREFFLWTQQNTTISRDEITDLQVDFDRFDRAKKGRINEVEAMMLLEHKGNSKSAVELRLMTSDLGEEKEGNRTLNFLEVCCLFHNIDWNSLNVFVDEDARAKALIASKAAIEASEIAKAKILQAKEEEEALELAKAKELEVEMKLKGVAAKAAAFTRRGSNTLTLTNEQKIRLEAANRRELKEATKKLKEASEEAIRHRSAEEIAREVADTVQRIADEEAAAEVKRKQEEAAARSARKAKLNMGW
eukprot:CAMPEP_0119035146 /NCGR_PEP_ID=MMETSP1177-20130426/2105_1 /TAXON_ID=2985 /ORGANISM="Ochromonas sp, Strain CCMP1899" /LENGTH=260 /DNA_ID=CAMNT_0006993087 /DNA_START=94 /DNA_END=873 /DNA_ORIENTATION=+